MSEVVIDKSKSGEYWRVTIGGSVEYFDHEPTASDLSKFRQSIVEGRRRAQAAELLRVQNRDGKVDGGFTVQRM